MVCDHRRSTALTDDLDLGEARLTQQIGHLAGATVHLVPTGRVGPHRLDTDQILEIAPHLRQDVAHAPDEITTWSRLGESVLDGLQDGHRRGGVSPWVSDTWIATSARCSAIAPGRRTLGLPHISLITSISRWMPSGSIGRGARTAIP